MRPFETTLIMTALTLAVAAAPSPSIGTAIGISTAAVARFSEFQVTGSNR